MSKVFWELLAPQRMTEVVDIGANPIDGDPPYKPMLAAGVCRVTGFEPQDQAFLALQERKGPHERYLHYAVGDGQTHTLNICRAPGMTSLLEPDPATLALFDFFKSAGEVIQRVPVATRKLDDISEIQDMDFLKIDIQGGELAVFQGGVDRLSRTVAIQVEVSFVALYKNQPCLGTIDLELRSKGFIPHCLAELKKWPIAPCVVNGDSRRPLNQLLEADFVYVRDFSRPESMSNEQLKHLALVAQYCYGSVDLALRCIMLLVQRNALEANAMDRYLTLASRK